MRASMHDQIRVKCLLNIHDVLARAVRGFLLPLLPPKIYTPGAGVCRAAYSYIILKGGLHVVSSFDSQIPAPGSRLSLCSLCFLAVFCHTFLYMPPYRPEEVSFFSGQYYRKIRKNQRPVVNQ